MADVVHISEEEAARDFGAVMQHIRSGDEVRLDCKDGVQAVVKRAGTSEPVKARKIDGIAGGLKERKGPAVPDADMAAEAMSPERIPGKTIPEILESLSKWEAVHGPLIVDEGFAQDVAEAHERFNRPLDATRWD
jgi:hypothetical protein